MSSRLEKNKEYGSERRPTPENLDETTATINEVRTEIRKNIFRTCLNWILGLFRNKEKVSLEEYQNLSRILQEERTANAALKFLLATKKSSPEEQKALIAALAEKDRIIEQLNASIQSALAEKDAIISQLNASIIALNEELAQFKQQIENKKHASADIIKLRETLLCKVQKLGTELLDSVEMVRAREGGAMASWFNYEMIGDIIEKCVKLFQETDPEILKDILLLQNAIEAHKKLTEESGKCDNIPSWELLNLSLEVYWKLSCLLIIQNQLIRDTLGAAGKEEEIEVPDEFMKDGKLKNYYETLGLEPTATEEEIKSAYREKAKENHPDLNKGNKIKEELFKEVQEAYETLSEQNKKALYDSFYIKFYNNSNQ